jgi:SET domain-containing protein
MYFMAKKPINIGEELTINYGVSYWQERNNAVISNESGADQSDFNIQAPGPGGKLNQVISTFPIPGEGQQ